ncbi:ferredoxin [Fervidicella metallireducens AeB]|uniref:Ferredoxin n=1 Tax=Fervidicella metallireducens AeB TaxID=1403537 RepID=A0A017RU04_9CLOT|nr:trans-4-hydroxy-L-proline dehydratase activase [Fervidicella metallireducens]EYE88147.1 ferredoxin [Fervidicella metallireducens AeB]
MKKGIVFNIQRYSIHDGPGIRTTVFLKGCPLNCLWCHNPESKRKSREIFFYKNRCLKCGMCIAICPQNALSIENNGIKTDNKKCIFCGRCAAVCNTNAREIVGVEMTDDELMKEIKKDCIFYEESGGGVTFSGGEPLYQYEFLKLMLKRCKLAGIHTVLDTCGFVSEEALIGISDYVDLFLYDIKLMDDDKHKKYTGVSNVLILNNLNKLDELQKKIFIRIPIIPGINDDENIEMTGKFLNKLKSIEKVCLLPYHKIALDKYKRLNLDYNLADTEEPTEEKMEQIAAVFKQYVKDVVIGG